MTVSSHQRRKTGLAIALLGLLLPLAACSASRASDQTAGYPSESLEMIVHVSPGGGWDTVSRAVADTLPTYLEGADQVMVLNRTSGGGTGQFANVIADASGHTLGPLPLPGIAAAAAVSPELVDLSKARPLGSLGEDPYVVVASKASGITSIEDVYERDRLVVGLSAGVSGGDYFVNVLMESSMDKDWDFVNHEGSSEASLSTIRGDVDLITQPLSSIAKSLPDDNLVPILVFSEEPVEQLPDVPIAAEAELTKDFAHLGRIYRVFFVSAETPDEVVRKLETALADIAADKGVIERMAASGTPVDYKPAAEIQDLLVDLETMVKDHADHFKPGNG